MPYWAVRARFRGNIGRTMSKLLRNCERCRIEPHHPVHTGKWHGWPCGCVIRLSPAAGLLQVATVRPVEHNLQLGASPMAEPKRQAVTCRLEARRRIVAHWRWVERPRVPLRPALVAASIACMAPSIAMPLSEVTSATRARILVCNCRPVAPRTPIAPAFRAIAVATTARSQPMAICSRRVWSRELSRISSTRR